MNTKIKKQCKILISYFLIGVMISISCLPALAADTYLWDGYVKTAIKSGKVRELEVCDFNNLGTILSSGADISSKYTKDYRYSAYWNDQVNTPSIYFPTSTNDWSEYNLLEMWLYSEKAVNSDFIFIVECKETYGYAYYSSKEKLDWSGWKRFVFALEGDGGNSLSRTREASLKEVVRIRFAASGWEMTPNPEASLYVGSLKLLATDLTGSLEGIYDYNEIEEVKSIMQNAVAVYAGSPNVIYGGEVTTLDGVSNDVITYDYNKTAIVPISFFEKYLKASVTSTDGKHNISIDGKTLSISLDDKDYKLDGEIIRFKTPPQMIDDMIYLPAAETSEMFGKHTLIEKKLVVIGEDSSINVFKLERGVNTRTEILAYMAAYIATDEADVTKEDLKIIKDKWRFELVGDEKNDISDPHIASIIKDIEANANRNWNRLRKGENIVDLFSDHPISTTAQLTTRYREIYQMALAYATYGSSLYQNEQLREDILYALEWMYNNKYGQAEIEGRGWRSTSIFNWWDWEIGVPGHMINTLMLMEEFVTMEKIKNYLSLFDHLVPLPKYTGSNKFNLVKMCIGAGLLQEDVERIIKSRDSIDDTLLYVDNGRNIGEGFYTDGSYIMHWHHSMNGTYGVAQLTETVMIFSILKGTKLEPMSPQADNMAEWIYNAFEPFIYKGGMFRMVKGRTPEGEHNTGSTVVLTMLDAIDLVDDEDAARIKSTIKYMVQNDTSIDYYRIASLAQIKKLKNIMEDDTIKVRSNYFLNKVFSRMDKVVHHREDYALAISMSSSRIYNYESINGQNLTGWYVGDGMTCLYNNDLTQYDTAYWTHVDPYRLPGITVDNQERKAVSVSKQATYLSSKDFVGGVSLNDTFGVAAMWLESYHSDEDYGPTNQNGGPNPAHDCSLEAQKAWFMFDDEIVVLGAGVIANDDADVYTIVENRKSNKMISILPEENIPVPYEIIGVTASQIPEPENIPENTLDGQYSTKWAANGEATIVWDIGDVHDVGYVGLSFANGSKRQQVFDLYVSTDNVSWEQVFSGRSSGTTEFIETFDLKNSKARYVRLDSHGSTANTWLSLTTVAIYPPNPDGSIEIPEAKSMGSEKVTIEGNVVANITDQDKSLKDIKWVHLEGTGGYYFPEGGNLYARWTDKQISFFELWFDHGINPNNSIYAYVLLPNKSVEETALYAENPDVEVLINTPKIQAVRQNKLGITGIVFWEAGEFEGITVSHPMIIMVRDTDMGYELAVSDPTQKLKKATITINKNLIAQELEKEITVTGNVAGKTQISVDFTDLYGVTLEALFLDQD